MVRLADRRVVVDPGGRLPGRGAYVCDDPVCRRAALTRGSLARALRTTIPPALAAELGLEGPDMIPTPTQGGARGQE